MTISVILMMLVGLILLVVGAELLVRGASRLAVAVGISPLVVGLTVVAYGTSSPELAVSVQSALGGQADLALGNVLGSNIFNVLFILGVSALITPLLVSRQLIRRDVPLMIITALLLWLMTVDRSVSRLDGLLLSAGAVGYTVWTIAQGRRETKQAQQGEDAPEIGDGPRSLPGQLALIVVGLLMLAAGSNWLVDGAVAVAEYFGVSEMVIGLTIVSIGTSLPEAATSVMASLRGERDIAVGNVIGSNIFNILAVLGAAAVVSPVPLQVPAATVAFDIPVVIVVSMLCLPIFFTGGQIARWEGLLFLVYYGLYVGFLLLAAGGSPWVGEYGRLVGWVILPLTVLVLLVSVGRAVALRRPIAG